VVAITSTKNKDRARDPDMHSSKKGNTLLLGDETVAFGDAGYQGIEKRADATPDVTWHVAMLDRAEKLKAGIRAKVEHPFRVIKLSRLSPSIFVPFVPLSPVECARPAI
jgi:IS5 family transposase